MTPAPHSDILNLMPLHPKVSFFWWAIRDSPLSYRKPHRGFLPIGSLIASLLEFVSRPDAKKTPEGVFFWWAIRDSNPGPTGYEPVALTN